MASSSSPSSSPDHGCIERVASNALQCRTVKVERLDDNVLCNYKLQPRADCFHLLKCRPPSHIRLLRHEEERLHSEAVVLQVLRGRSDIEVPRVISFERNRLPTGGPILITGPHIGSVLADVESVLSRQALSRVDKSLGLHIKELSRIAGSTFGSMRQATPNMQTWSRTFISLLESILRDAEDALVSLPYEVIRHQVRRHRAALDKITRPKLTLLETASDKNVTINTNDMSVSGLLDFSSAIWGDPYMSDCFYKPSVSFVEGFGKLPNRTIEERTRQYLYEWNVET